jgi:hypothetical protein
MKILGSWWFRMPPNLGKLVDAEHSIIYVIACALLHGCVSGVLLSLIAFLIFQIIL